MAGAQAVSCLASSRARTSKTAPSLPPCLGWAGLATRAEHWSLLQLWESRGRYNCLRVGITRASVELQGFLGCGPGSPKHHSHCILPVRKSPRPAQIEGIWGRGIHSTSQGGSAGKRGQELVGTIWGVGCHNHRFVFLRSISNL